MLMKAQVVFLLPKKIRRVDIDDSDEKIEEEKEETLNEWKWFLSCSKNTQHLSQFG
jgi:hypothetical protein